MGNREHAQPRLVQRRWRRGVQAEAHVHSRLLGEGRTQAVQRDVFALDQGAIRGPYLLTEPAPLDSCRGVRVVSAVDGDGAVVARSHLNRPPFDGGVAVGAGHLHDDLVAPRHREGHLDGRTGEDGPAVDAPLVGVDSATGTGVRGAEVHRRSDGCVLDPIEDDVRVAVIVLEVPRLAEPEEVPAPVRRPCPDEGVAPLLGDRIGGRVHRRPAHALVEVRPVEFVVDRAEDIHLDAPEAFVGFYPYADRRLVHPFEFVALVVRHHRVHSRRDDGTGEFVPVRVRDAPVLREPDGEVVLADAVFQHQREGDAAAISGFDSAHVAHLLDAAAAEAEVTLVD